MSNLSPEDKTFMTNLRVRNTPGHPEPPTLDEMKRAIILLRGNRTAAVVAAASATKKPKPKATPIAVGDALADLENF